MVEDQVVAIEHNAHGGLKLFTERCLSCLNEMSSNIILNAHKNLACCEERNELMITIAIADLEFFVS